MDTVKFEERKIILTTEEGTSTWTLQRNPEIELGQKYIRHKGEIYFLKTQ
jgi:hypothetical protein